VLRSFIRHVLVEMMQSHTREPVLGDEIINTNPGCKHFKSTGIVTSVDSLPGESGRVIKYVVTNAGDTFEPGDTLEKTLDQLDFL
jgi:hypothetical protein